jgi:hypothetical protein
MESAVSAYHLRKLNVAAEWLSAAAGAWPDGFGRDRGLCSARVAVVEVARGKIDGACAVGHDALAVARVAESARTLAVLAFLKNRLRPRSRCVPCGVQAQADDAPLTITLRGDAVDTLPKATSVEVAESGPAVAVSPVGSFEQHGGILPLATDTIVACAIAQAVADKYSVLLLPPITLSPSHEHSGFTATVSISATPLFQVIRAVQASLEQ